MLSFYLIASFEAQMFLMFMKSNLQTIFSITRERERESDVCFLGVPTYFDFLLQPHRAT